MSGIFARGVMGFCESAYRGETLPEYWNSYSALFILFHTSVLSIYLWWKRYPRVLTLDLILWCIFWNGPASFAYHYSLNVWAGMLDTSTITTASWLGALHVWWMMLPRQPLLQFLVTGMFIAGWQLVWTYTYLPDTTIELQNMLMVPNGALILGLLTQTWFFRRLPIHRQVNRLHLGGVSVALLGAILWLITEPHCRQNATIKQSLWWTHGLVHYLFSLGYCLLLFAQYRIVQVVHEGMEMF